MCWIPFEVWGPFNFLGVDQIHKDYDVIIVGGGIAGLRAAQILSKAGKRTIILEARAILGGRVQSIKKYKTHTELGAEYVHGSPDDLTFLQGTEVRQVPGFRFLEPAGAGNLVKAPSIFSAWDDFSSTVANDILTRVPLTEYLGENPVSNVDLDRLFSYVRVFHAADPEKILLSSILLEEAEDLEILSKTTGPYDQIIHNIGSEISGFVDLCLNSTVKSIRGSSDMVEVECRDGRRFSGSYCVVTASIGVLKSGSIDIRPMDEAFASFLDSAQMGGVVKINAVFKEKMYQMDSVFVRNPGGMFEVWMSNDNRPVVVGWSGGPPSFAFSHKTNDQIIETAIKELGIVFNLSKAEIQSNLLGITFHNWNRDPYFLGAYSFPAVQTSDDIIKILERQLDTRIGFAGEAYDQHGLSGTVQGAYFSGHGLATQILERI